MVNHVSSSLLVFISGYFYFLTLLGELLLLKTWPTGSVPCHALNMFSPAEHLRSLKMLGELLETFYCVTTTQNMKSEASIL